MSQKLIAISGGTGTIGSSIVRALLGHPRYIPIVLSRGRAGNPPNTSSFVEGVTLSESSRPYHLETRYVDYSSIDSLTAELTGVHTVISALLIPGPEIVDYQLNLLNASIAAGVSRFAPSEFALCQEAHAEVDIDRAKIVVWNAVCAAVQRGDIDAAAFPCGMFMNYLAVGSIHSADDLPFYKRENPLAGFREGPLMFHLAGPEPWVEVPLTQTGEFPELSMTDIRDVGKFVVAALGIEVPWGGRELGMVGETANMSDIVGIIEGVLGKKVEVRGVTRAELQTRLERIDQGDFLGRIDLEYTMVCGTGGSVVRGNLNYLCPQVQPVTIRQFMEEAWGKRL
ncbi:hypothetical protein BJX63DRAFT_57336 [Aspergillus granulosus]|uniref:NmrA-like domain-containing protein n=1 Tax=Aspergillus granulosus TaxID=176169 RepID=A0ABR4GXD3_9EURO